MFRKEGKELKELEELEKLEKLEKRFIIFQTVLYYLL